MSAILTGAALFQLASQPQVDAELLGKEALQARAQLIQLEIRVVAASVVELLAPPEGGVKVHGGGGGLAVLIAQCRVHDWVVFQHAVMSIPAMPCESYTMLHLYGSFDEDPLLLSCA